MKTTVKGNMLHLEIPLEKARESSTGKTLIRYSSKGFQAVDAKLRVNVTVIERKS